MSGLRDFTLPLVIAALAALFGFLAPDFLSARNFSMLLIEISITAVLAMGMLLVILAGHIDLSAGSGVGLAGGIAAVLVHRAGWPAPLAMALPFVLLVLVWMAMALLIMVKEIQAFIVTLGGMLVFRGLFWLTIRSTTVPVSRGGENNSSLLINDHLPPAGPGARPGRGARRAGPPGMALVASGSGATGGSLASCRFSRRSWPVRRPS